MSLKGNPSPQSHPAQIKQAETMSSTGAPSKSPKKGGGGILRSRKRKGGGDVGEIDGGGPGAAAARASSAGRGVTFSTNHRGPSSSRTPTNFKMNAEGAADGGEYDSDEVEDAILASGDALSLLKQHKNGDDDEIDDAAVRTAAEVEEARRRRGRVRRREDDDDVPRGDLERDLLDEDRDAKDEASMSLITDGDADPDAYESNAPENAACPVEPFNMESEKESGLGYFDGDTYVFRHGNRVEGEKDAWLDGFGDDEEGGGKDGGGGGGLDSTSVWKPSESKKDGATKIAKNKRKAKFVDEDATPEDLGRRLATLLNDNETVMAALTRHGASLRGLQAREQKMAKKAKSKKRKSAKSQSKREGEEPSREATSTTSDSDAEAKMLKIKMTETRDTVEELTELADALLFGGENDAYELTRGDWIHRFELERYFPSEGRKRPSEAHTDVHTADADAGDGHAKKKSRGYFDDSASNATEEKAEQAGASGAPPPRHEEEVAWEYRGNEDGAVHGPYTSKQMHEWTSCGYFVGEGAVDIRRVKNGGNGGGGGDAPVENEKKEGEENAKEEAEADVDELMADLMDDDDNEGETKTEDSDKAATDEDSSWMRSDRVDFTLYL